MIALIAAVPQETELLRRFLSPCEVLNCGRRDIFRGSLFGQQGLLLHSGVGKANAAAAATSLIDFGRPSLVVSIGCGGAYMGSGLNVGDLAVASEEVYGDEGVRAPDGFLDMHSLGLPLVQRSGINFYNRFPVNAQFLAKARPILESFAAAAGRQLAFGPFVTVSTGAGTDAAARELVDRTGGICENMEGAAIAQICAMHSLPFLAIRGISNHTGHRDLSQWNIKKGAEVAQLAVRALLSDWHERKDSA
ncbi:MAG: futalosine hydrolase [Desulfuromonadales bacterium]